MSFNLKRQSALVKMLVFFFLIWIKNKQQRQKKGLHHAMGYVFFVSNQKFKKHNQENQKLFCT